MSVTVRSPEDRLVLQQWRKAGQDQVFRFWDRLDPPQQARLLDQLRRFPIDLIEELARAVIEGPSIEIPSEWTPPPTIGLPRNREEQETAEDRIARGETALREGRCAPKPD